MSKLIKMDRKVHAKACELLKKEDLSDDEKWFVVENWHEGASHEQGHAGAFFTPMQIAMGVAIHASEQPRVIDLCAGIGALSFALHIRSAWYNIRPKIVCVERNPDYVAVGRKILPEATWIEADVFDLPTELTGYDCAISNPPFGKVKTAPANLKHATEYEVIRIASRIARFGVFVLPSGSVPFRVGQESASQFDIPCAKYERFSAETGIRLEPNCGIITVGEEIKWHGTNIATEIALAEFEDLAPSKDEAVDVISSSSAPLHHQLPLFV
jgi:predicted RNA methylase